MEPTMSPLTRRLLLAASALVLAGCAASTSIVGQWRSPEPGPPLTRLLVVGVFQEAAVRRIFEDEMVAALRARGVEAQPSYRFIPQDGPVPQEAIERAVRDSGATGVLSTRVVRVASQVQVIPTGPAVWGPPWGFYGWYGAAWGPAFAYPFPPAQVVATETVYGEVRLFAAADDTLIWAASTATFAPGNPQRDSANFAKVVADQLAAGGLI
jgi:hypothetical protein